MNSPSKNFTKCPHPDLCGVKYGHLPGSPGSKECVKKRASANGSQRSGHASIIAGAANPDSSEGKYPTPPGLPAGDQPIRVMDHSVVDDPKESKYQTLTYAESSMPASANDTTNRIVMRVDATYSKAPNGAEHISTPRWDFGMESDTRASIHMYAPAELTEDAKTVQALSLLQADFNGNIQGAERKLVTPVVDYLMDVHPNRPDPTHQPLETVARHGTQTMLALKTAGAVSEEQFEALRRSPGESDKAYRNRIQTVLRKGIADRLEGIKKDVDLPALYGRLRNGSEQ